MDEYLHANMFEEEIIEVLNNEKPYYNKVYDNFRRE